MKHISRVLPSTSTPPISICVFSGSVHFCLFTPLFFVGFSSFSALLLSLNTSDQPERMHESDLPVHPGAADSRLYRFIPFPKGRGVVAGANPSCLRANPGWTSCQLITGQGPEEQFAICSRTLLHAAQLSPGYLGFAPATFPSLVYLLYPLSYSDVVNIERDNVMYMAVGW